MLTVLVRAGGCWFTARAMFKYDALSSPTYSVPLAWLRSLSGSTDVKRVTNEFSTVNKTAPPEPPQPPVPLPPFF